MTVVDIHNLYARAYIERTESNLFENQNRHGA